MHDSLLFFTTQLSDMAARKAAWESRPEHSKDSRKKERKSTPVGVAQ
jgi:hypothetical protein